VRLLDRSSSAFLQVYLYCIAAFISIWLIFDISDNISTFIDEHMVSCRRPLLRHAGPASVYHSAAVSLLLALLFTLGRMSRANEIVSMLTGRR